MNINTAIELLATTKGIYPLSKINEDDTLKVWMSKFGNRSDETMKKALDKCYEFCHFFPAPADIVDALKIVTYDEQTKPKQIEYRPHVSAPVIKAAGLLDTKKVKDFIKDIDISDVMNFARFAFKNISEETVKNNYQEILAAKKSYEMCKVCTWTPIDCVLGGYKASMRMGSNGYIVNEMVRCEK